ncbi:peroxisomal membrane protein PEX14-like [Strongylocentrotus purpuratus]|uniref:Peroxisomal membrane protein PEX14 n=1 Tax=Strongylocentrotus purpuratus TaxID=7668 RepID=A0A7M7NWP5_STRPU|nr:peroxisomal membrane protein PEX14-like [Strongylocentrotus purpuratus]
MSAERDTEGSAGNPAVNENGPGMAPAPAPAPALAPGGASSPVAAPEAPREKMIETAVKFLLNPQVRSSPMAQKKAFLRKKGVKDPEIELAIDRSGTRQDVAPPPANQTPTAPPPQGQVPMATHPGAVPQQQMVPYMQPPPPPRVTTWRDYAATAVIISGVSFGIYKLIMKFVSPWLKSRKEEKERMNRLEASIEELNKNVSEAVTAMEKSISTIQGLMEKQEQQLTTLNSEVVSGKALSNGRRSTDTTEIKSEIMSLKGLLLSRHQFPSTPQRTTIPSWQRSSDQSSTKSNSPPPVSTEATNGNISSSPPPPPLLSGEPVTNGDSSSADPAQTPVKEPITENGAEDAVQKDPSPTPDEHVNGSVKPIDSQATPTLEGTA